MDCSGSEFNVQGFCQLIKFQHILGITVGNGDSEADIFKSQSLQFKQGSQPMIKTVLYSS